jgi:hypothetical protein
MLANFSLKVFLIISILSYSPKNNHNNYETLKDYNAVRNNILLKKAQLKSKFIACRTNEDKNIVLENSRQLLTASLTDEIIPFWYGTKWTFEGHSEIPNQGSVACGYFVSTTLNHVGMKINRYKLAQKGPEDEPKTIQPGKKTEKIKNISVEALKTHFINTKKDGIYFIGLDFHVGYILKSGNEVSFIHSNYINSEGVIKENISTSKAIISTTYCIADITYNDVLVKKWLMGEVIKTD